MGMVIGFDGFRTSRQRRANGSRHLVPDQAEFTPRDRADLERWSRRDRSVSFCASELGAFAMLYEGGEMWASWGVVRQGRTVLVWNCVTLADVGRFATMTEALAGLPTEDSPASCHNVVHVAFRDTEVAARSCQA